MEASTGSYLKMFFVLNPVAGGGANLYYTERIQEFCNQTNIAPVFEYTTGDPGDQNRIKANFEQNKYDAVIACGGDGTINLAGNLVVGTQTPLGILPLGSANGLSKNLGIPSHYKKALEVISKFNTQTIDTLRINEENGFHISDLGFNAHIMKFFARSNIRGILTYGWYSLKEFFSYHPSFYEIITPNHFYRRKAFMIAMTNMNRFGTNLIINSLGKPNDGYFEVCVVKEFPKKASFEILKHLYNNTIHLSPYMEIISTRKVTIINSEERSFHIDGEPNSHGREVHAEVRPKSLNVIVPERR